jgi:hypothetical protein
MSNNMSQPGQTPGFSLSLPFSPAHSLFLSGTMEEPPRWFLHWSPFSSPEDRRSSTLVSYITSTSSSSLGLSFGAPLMVLSFFLKASSQGIELDLLRRCSPSIPNTSPKFNPSLVSYLLPRIALKPLLILGQANLRFQAVKHHWCVRASKSCFLLNISLGIILRHS